jgi:hypothetical protein
VQHPTLRKYTKLAGTSYTETDLEFALYPLPREIPQAFDQIQRQNATIKLKLNEQNLTCTQAGFIVFSNDMPNQDLPGNFGSRLVDKLFPSDHSVVFKQRNSVLVNGVTAVDCSNLVVPQCMSAPDQVDYLSEEESDDPDAEPFRIPVPDLAKLIESFEEDDQLLKATKTA